MNFEKLSEIALRAGFTKAGRLSADTLAVLPEVRKMCEQNTCGRYGKSWSCPPGCGSLSETQEKIARYHEGILLQTVGDLEDEFDGEGMMEAENRHKESLLRMRELMEEEYPNALFLGAGSCTVCKKCTYPDAPCRFPEKRISSMEASGLLVLDVCKKNGMTYYYGSDKISYTSCVLID